MERRSDELGHTNVWAAGALIATYSPNGSQTVLNFHFTDWLGTRRVLTDSAGNNAQSCASLPFGNGENCPATPTEHLFTQKERDAESGNDYFGARYYSSLAGRFLTPDWSAKVEPVPYAKMDNPQSLNLYAYVDNNPLSGVDADGHYFVVGAQNQKFYQQVLTDLYRRPGGRELVNSLANSDRPVILDRGFRDTANTGNAAITLPLVIAGQRGIAGVHVTVGTNADLMAGAKMAPGKVSPDITTGHELEHANDTLTAGQTSVAAGAAADAAGDPKPGAKNTLSGTAQKRAEGIMDEKTDMSKTDASTAIQSILKSGQQQWSNSAVRSALCSQIESPSCR